MTVIPALQSGNPRPFAARFLGAPPAASQSAPRFSRAGAPTGDVIRFGSDLSGFRNQDVAWIRNHLKEYRYGRDLARMLDPNTRMRAFYHQGKVVLRNFEFLPHREGEARQGVCQEVAQQCLETLEQRFGDRYVFQMVHGSAPDYFLGNEAIHLFLLGWTRENDEKVRAQLAESRFIVPEEAIIIDPSFGVISDRAGARGYRMNGRATPENREYTAGGHEAYTVIPLETLRGRPNPLGYMRDLDPQAATRLGGDQLVFLLLCHDREGKPTYRLLTQGPQDREPVQWKQWQADVAADGVLRKFLDKLASDLAQPPDVGLFDRLRAGFAITPVTRWLPEERHRQVG